MALISKDDFIELHSKIRQRGWKFIASKFNLNAKARTQSAFNESLYQSANWWIIPAVRRRWNEKITGCLDKEYEQFIIEDLFQNKKGLTMLSIGCGVGSHEIKLAQSDVFGRIVAVDLVEHLIKTARKTASDQGIHKIDFRSGDFMKMDWKEQFDVVFFHASLHHFPEIENLITSKIIPLLRPEGHVIMNEYVGPNRLQCSAERREAITEMLQLIPVEWRTRFRRKSIKKQFSGPGLLRMIIADPSECVDSESILPVLRKFMLPVIERPFGGNLLMGGLKDIAHHFAVDDPERNSILQGLFQFEDKYLEHHTSDFYFGIYQLKAGLNE